MNEGAKIESIDALKHLRIALFKFAEAGNAALNDAESEMRQTQNWLENEQFSYWQGQIRKRHDLVERAKEALRAKQLFADSSGRIPQAPEEEKALRLARARFEEAEQKLANVRKYTRALVKEIQTYKGSAQRFATTIQVDIPQAAALLEQFMAKLEQYVALDPNAGESAPPPPGGAGHGSL